MTTNTASPAELRAQAEAALAAGRLPEARQLYERLGAGPGAEARDWASLGMVLGSLGELDSAERACRRAIEVDPGCAEAHCNLGVLAEMRQDFAAAATHHRVALDLVPDNPRFLHHLGQSLIAVGDLASARACYERALTLAPQAPTLHLGLGTVLEREGNLPAARTCFQTAISIRPGAEPHFRLGNLESAAGQPQAAREQYERALAIDPRHAGALNNLGQLLATSGDTEGARRMFDAAIAADPRHAGARGNLAEALIAAGDFPGAAATLEQALALDPRSALNHRRLGDVCRELKRFDRAAEHYRAALELDPRQLAAQLGLGSIFLAARRHDWAIEAFHNALAIDPEHIVALKNLGFALQVSGDIAAALACYRQVLERDPLDAMTWDNLLFNLNYHPQITARAICEEHRRWGETLGRTRANLGAPRNPRAPERKLRVGYVTPDLAGHSVAHFLEPVLAHHDPARFETLLYTEAIGTTSDALNDRIRGLAGQWQETSGLGDEALAERIRADGVDVLVDLGGHTRANRVLTFAFRPAPVQATWLGYCNTTGLPAMDYRLTDKWADPPGHEAIHTEKLVRIPHGFLCYRPPDHAPEVAPLPLHTAGHVSFGSFNILEKTNREVVALWARVLVAVPDSRLILKNRSWNREQEGSASRERYREWFANHGVEPDRIEFVGWLPEKSAHLELYSRIDIGLDTFPYNGTTTTCEALWMGVPVMTLAGDRHSARVGTSLMTRVGLPECVGLDADDFVAKAAALAADPARLSQTRSNLRARMRASTLCDATAFTRELEETYRTLWRHWCAAPPAA